jgi:hypothetical protein
MGEKEEQIGGGFTTLGWETEVALFSVSLILFLIISLFTNWVLIQLKYSKYQFVVHRYQFSYFKFDIS